MNLRIAHLLHRLSGLGLALFLPLHFLMLSRATTGELDAFLTFAEHPLVKLAETGLVALLALHLFGGLRLMAFEFTSWRGPQKTWAAAALAGSFAVSMLFLLRAF